MHSRRSRRHKAIQERRETADRLCTTARPVTGALQPTQSTWRGSSPASYPSRTGPTPARTPPSRRFSGFPEKRIRIARTALPVGPARDCRHPSIPPARRWRVSRRKASKARSLIRGGPRRGIRVHCSSRVGPAGHCRSPPVLQRCRSGSQRALTAIPDREDQDGALEFIARPAWDLPGIVARRRCHSGADRGGSAPLLRSLIGRTEAASGSLFVPRGTCWALSLTAGRAVVRDEGAAGSELGCWSHAGSATQLRMPL